MSKNDDIFYDFNPGYNLDDIMDFGDDYDDCYDEDGMGVTCERCDSDIIWYEGNYICRGCGEEYSRPVFFNYIGAEPPDPKCITCKNNYPVCKSWCEQVEINPSDEFYF